MMNPKTLLDALNAGSASDAGFTFLSDAGPRVRSYAEMRRAASRFAAGLQRAGLRRGDVVALVIADAEQFLIALLGTVAAGAVPASLYPPSATSDLRRFIDATGRTITASGARTVVTTAALAHAFQELQVAAPHLQSVLRSDTLGVDADPEPSSASPDDIAFIQYTSGSTSSPKGVAITHRALAANIEGIYGSSGLAVTSDDVSVSWLPLYHDMGLVGMALGPLYGARPAVLMGSEMFVKRPIEWLRAIARHRATISYAPNFAYDLCVRRVKDRDLDGLDLSAWRVAGCGAEPVNAATLEAFTARFARAGFRAASFLPSYGLAEHVLAATFGVRGREPRVDVVCADALAADRIAMPPAGDESSAIRLVSCGRPLLGHALRILRDDGSPAGEREVGEIALAGPSVMRGYYNDAGLTSRVVRDGWLHTGDLGYVSDEELFVCGRLKDLIVIHGRKYHPQDLEWSVESLPGIKRGRVVAFGTSGAGVHQVVIVAEASGTAAAASVASDIKRAVGDLFGLAVGEIVLVPGGTIKRTTSGKVRRAAVRAAYERGELAGAANPAGLHA
jgi:fatty-acyl-CoA synthase